MTKITKKLPRYRRSVGGTFLVAREAAMAPIRPILREAGVTEQQWRVLRVLSDAGQDIDAAQLAYAALLYPPSVTRILKQLGDLGLVEREVDKNDGRRLLLRISEAGLALVSQQSSRIIKVINLHAKTFGDERLTAMLDEIRAFTDCIISLHDDDTHPRLSSIRMAKPTK